MVSRLGFLNLLLFSLFLPVYCRSSPDHSDVLHVNKPRTSRAYVTLLYGDEFVLGVRVLGQSIRNTGTNKDMVVLVSDGVSLDAIKLLMADGWRVEVIDLLANPNQKRPARFWGVYTKLKIFNMTEYEKVVYLDADTLVLRSIEDLFECQKFCANLKHSERLNSGVMVVEPSASTFADMLTKVNTLYSYTGGDQGFLNSYYADFPNARLFDPSLSAEERKNLSPKMERLSTLYNADVGLYVLANKWMVDANELRVVHYTLGPLKPWDWWTSWLLKPVDLWQNVRKQLKGTTHGDDPHSQLIVWLLYIVPVLVLVIINRRMISQMHQDFLLCNGSLSGYTRHVIYSTVNCSNFQQYRNGNGSPSSSSRWPSYLGVLSIGICFATSLFAVGVAVYLVPRHVMPWTGIVIAYEWTFFLFMLIFGKYLESLQSWGRSYGTSGVAKGRTKTSSGFDSGTFFYGLLMALVAIIAPSVPFIFGVTAIFLRVGLMAGGAMVLAVFMTHAAEHLAIRSFLRGLEDSNLLQPSDSFDL